MTIPILQIRKPRLIEFKKVNQVHTTTKWPGQGFQPTSN